LLYKMRQIPMYRIAWR